MRIECSQTSDQASLDQDSILGTLESYATLTDESGKMLAELARQLSRAGRKVDELKGLSETIILESRTWRLLEFIARVQESSPCDMEFDGKIC